MKHFEYWINKYKCFDITFETKILYNENIKLLAYFNNSINRRYTCLQTVDDIGNHQFLTIIDNKEKNVNYFDINGYNGHFPQQMRSITNKLSQVLKIALIPNLDIKRIYLHYLMHENESGLCMMWSYYITLILNIFNVELDKVIDYFESPRLKTANINRQKPRNQIPTSLYDNYFEYTSIYKFIQLIMKMKSIKHEELIKLIDKKNYKLPQNPIFPN